MSKEAKAQSNILFVCLGNIIRSPAAEAILRSMVGESNDFAIASCAVGVWSLGEVPDSRMALACKKRGYEMMADKRSRLIQSDDFVRYDYILAADRAVYQKLLSLAPLEYQEKIQMMTAYSPRFKNESVPDPYYSDEKVFDMAVEMVEDACHHFHQFLKH